MIFFFDENMLEKAARMLGAYDPDHEVWHLLDRFPRGTPDVEWMQELASDSERPVVVCADGRILKNQQESSREGGLEGVRPYVRAHGAGLDPHPMADICVEDRQGLA